jgi:uncharacterized protein YqjF (DUF2071 family)
MTWRNLLFLHWRVEASLMQALLPKGLVIDTFDGSAWIGLVPFQMDRTRPFGIPGIPTLSRFFECNVRTYVLQNGIPGIWFFSLDAASRLAVFGGRNFWKLNYVHATFNVSTDGDNVDYHLRRQDGTSTRINWTAGEALPESEAGSLRHFLTERCYLYAGQGDRLWRSGIFHEPWSLRRAVVRELDDHLVADAGIPVEGDPSCMAATPLHVKGWSLRRVQ